MMAGFKSKETRHIVQMKGIRYSVATLTVFASILSLTQHVTFRILAGVSSKLYAPDPMSAILAIGGVLGLLVWFFVIIDISRCSLCVDRDCPMSSPTL